MSLSNRSTSSEPFRLDASESAESCLQLHRVVMTHLVQAIKHFVEVNQRLAFAYLQTRLSPSFGDSLTCCTDSRNRDTLYGHLGLYSNLRPAR
jgi:hypothetical protein